MTPVRRLLILISLLAGFALSADAETLSLSKPFPATCVTDDGAAYSVDNGELKPVHGQFMIFPDGSQALRPQTAVSLDGEPGQLLRMFVWSAEPLDSVSIQVGRPGKPALTKTAGFRVQYSDGRDAWAALLGIPAWSEERDYTLTLTVRVRASAPTCCCSRSP